MSEISQSGRGVGVPARASSQELVEAIERGRFDEARRLVAQGADLNAQASNGASIVQLAVEARYAAFLHDLLKAGADANAIGTDGDTALMSACRGDYPVEARLLLEFGADPNRSNNGWTPLRYAARDRNTPTVRILLQGGAVVGAGGDEPWAAGLDAFVREVLND